MSVSRSQFFALKVLVTNNTAGNIIGKGGSAIKALQHDTGCGVKVRHARNVTPALTRYARLDPRQLCPRFPSLDGQPIPVR